MTGEPVRFYWKQASRSTRQLFFDKISRRNWLTLIAFGLASRAIGLTNEILGPGIFPEGRRFITPTVELKPAVMGGKTPTKRF
jgi:hypothetical protein